MSDLYVFQGYDARPLEQRELARLMRSCLAAGPSEESSVSLGLTRLQYLDGSLADSADWEELAWLVRQGWHFQELREERHPLLAVLPRRRLQAKLEYYLSRAVIKAIVLLEAMEPRFARSVLQHGATPRDLPEAAFIRHSEVDGETLSVHASARLLEAALPVFSRIITMIESLQLDGHVLDLLRESWPHLKWHTIEVNAMAPYPRPLRAFRRTEANRLHLVALEYAQAVLRQCRTAWLQLETKLDPAFAIAIER